MDGRKGRITYGVLVTAFDEWMGVWRRTRRERERERKRVHKFCSQERWVGR
jgi:hypothetical protein